MIFPKIKNTLFQENMQHLLIRVSFIILMKFCPLCFKLLLIESSTTGNRLICKICRYYYPLTKQQKIVIKYAK
jgi:hypothetical protein